MNVALAEKPVPVGDEQTNKEASQVACRQIHAHVGGTQTDLQYNTTAKHTLMTHDVTTLAVCKHCKLTSLGPIIDHCTEAFFASLCSVQAFLFDCSAKLPLVLHMAWSAGLEGKQVHLAEQPCLPRVSDGQAEAHADQNIWTAVSIHLCF